MHSSSRQSTIGAINLVGALHMHHAVLPGMAARKRGRIVNIASDAARVGSSGEAVYAACKGGLVAFSKTIAREHARHGITVNVVCPGPTDTALFADYKAGAGNPEKLMEAFTRSIPLGRIGQPDDLPGAILFFASDDAKETTLRSRFSNVSSVSTLKSSPRTAYATTAA